MMKAAASRTDLAIDWRTLPIGKHGHEEHGNTLPAVTEAALRDRETKSANFDIRDQDFAGSQRYSDWKFLYEPPTGSAAKRAVTKLASRYESSNKILNL